MIIRGIKERDLQIIYYTFGVKAQCALTPNCSDEGGDLGWVMSPKT